MRLAPSTVTGHYLQYSPVYDSFPFRVQASLQKKGWHFLLEGFRLTLYRCTGVLGGAHTALMLRDKKGSDVSEGESNFFIAL